MNEKKEHKLLDGVDDLPLGYYVEGDYMVEEREEEYYEKEVIFAQENLAGFKIAIREDHIIELRGPNQTTVVYDFDNKEDWEAFCEATWKTENYIPMKRTDFIEFYEALRFAHHYHSRNLQMAKRKLIESQREVSEQEKDVTKLTEILIGYEEVYNESKV